MDIFGEIAGELETALEAEPPKLQFKAAPAFLGGDTALDVKPEGIVTAIVSVTGVVDEVNDILEPGCYTETLRKRRPKVIRAHTWTEAVGRVLSIEELKPGDSRLPRETKDGQPWPAAAGALVATMQYNLATERGRAAFEDIRFYSESKEAEYSIGYQVPKGASYRDSKGTRRVRKVDLFEISDVLFGAAPLSMTLSLKDATAAPAGDEPGPDAAAGDGPDPFVAEAAALEAELHAAATDEIDWDFIAAADPGEGGPARDPDAPEAPSPADPEVPAEPGAEPAAGEDGAATADAIPAAAEQAESGAGGQLEAGQPAMTMIGADELAEGLSLLGEADAAEVKRKFTAPQRRDAAETGAAMKDGSFPIHNAADLKNAITALGRAKDSSAARAHIVKRARALKLTALLPADWPESTKDETKVFASAEAAEGAGIITQAEARALEDMGETKSSDAALAWAGDNAALIADMASPEAKAGGADRNRGQAEKLRRWYVHGEGAAKIRWNEGGDWQRCVDIAQKHMTPENARGYCELRHEEATGMTTSQHAARDRKLHGKDGEPGEVETKLMAWDPAAEIGPAAAHRAPEAKDGSKPGGWGERGDSMETRREQIRGAVVQLLGGSPDADGRYPWDQVTLLGTWPDRVIARRETWPEGTTSEPVSESFEVGYLVTAEGEVELGSPRPVDIDTAVDPSFDATVLQSSVAGALEDATAAVKLLLGQEDLQVKEGRVLSRVNLKRLRDAVTSLLAVLAAAGVEVDKPTEEQVKEEIRAESVPPEYTGRTGDTTSDGARDLTMAAFGRKDAQAPVITSAELAEGLALIGSVWDRE